MFGFWTLNPSVPPLDVSVIVAAAGGGTALASSVLAHAVDDTNATAGIVLTNSLRFIIAPLFDVYEVERAYTMLKPASIE
jgi:hypothetical protein